MQTLLPARGLLAVRAVRDVRAVRLRRLAGFRRGRQADVEQAVWRAPAWALGLRRNQDRRRLALRRVPDYAGRRGGLRLTPSRCQIGQLDR